LETNRKLKRSGVDVKVQSSAAGGFIAVITTAHADKRRMQRHQERLFLLRFKKERLLPVPFHVIASHQPEPRSKPGGEIK